MEGSESSVLVPKTIFFWTGKRTAWKDWESCFPLKAAEVYKSITKRQADAKAMHVATKLLIFTAENCVKPPAATETKVSGDTGNVAAKQPAATETNASGDTMKEIQTQSQKSGGSTLRNLSEPTKIAIDAVYLVVCVLHDLKYEKSPSRKKLDARYAYDRRQDGISDVVKMCNQLPLSHLKDTVDRFPAALDKALASLKPMVAEDNALTTTIKDFKLSFGKDSFHGAIGLFCWYYSPFYSKALPKTDEKQQAPFAGKSNLLDCLYSTLVDASPRAAPVAEGDVDVGRPEVRLHKTATQLVKSGLALGALPAGGKIRAQFSENTLQVPAVVLDAKLETVVTNLLAWERAYMEERPLARYLILLGDLAAEEGDAKVLERAGVLRGEGRKKGVEVVELLKRLNGFASCSRAYPAIDDEVEKMMAAHEEKMGWLSLRSRPAVVLASAAVLVSLVMATIVAKRRTA